MVFTLTLVNTAASLLNWA